MGVIIRQSIKGTIVNYIGVAVGFFTTFFVLTRFLTTEEIGLTRVLVDASTLLAGLAQLGTSASVMRYYPYFRDGNKKDHGFFFWSLVIPFIGFIIYGLVFIFLKVPISSFFAEKSPLFVNYYYFVLPMAFFILYMAVFETNSNVLLRIVVPKLIREVGIRVMLLAVYLLYAFHVLSIDGFVIAFCLVYGLASLLNIVYLFSLKKVSLKPDFKHLTKSLKKDYLFYTLFLITASLGNAIMPSINTFFISAKMGLAFTGIFAIASYIAILVEVPNRALNTIAQPHISQAVKNNDIAEVNKISKNVSLHQFLAGSFILFLIWINIEIIFKILPNGGQYIAGKSVVILLGVMWLFNSTASVGASVLGYSRYYYFSLLFTFLTTAIAIILNILLIPQWGMNGAACASLLATTLNYSLLLGLIWWKMKTSPFSKGQLKTVVVIVVLLSLNKLWLSFLTQIIVRLFDSNLFGNILESAVRTVLLLIVGVLSVYFWKISDEINGLVQKGLKYFKKSN